MKEIKLKYTNDLIYYEKLENGLEIYVIPNNKINKHYVTLTTKFGSNKIEFVPLGKKVMKKYPKGIAHFLEHKVFEQEDNIDPFVIFSKNGSSANAHTSKTTTTYEFSGINNFYKNLSFLLDYVQKPYFTDLNVEKEKPIIKEEINMVEDDVDRMIFGKLNENLFNIHPERNQVSGKAEDIETITKEDLYDCYNTFYNPSNMFIVISGNINVNETIKVIKENQKKKENKSFEKIELRKYNEPLEVRKEYEEIEFNVKVPKIAIAIKLKYNVDSEILNHYLKALLDYNFGGVSKFSEEMKEKGLINFSISTYVKKVDEFSVIYIETSGENYKEIMLELEKNIKRMDLTEKELEIYKKYNKSIYIYTTDSIYSLNDYITYVKVNYNNNEVKIIEKIENLNIKEYKEIKSKLDFSNLTKLIVKEGK